MAVRYLSAQKLLKGHAELVLDVGGEMLEADDQLGGQRRQPFLHFRVTGGMLGYLPQP